MNATSGCYWERQSGLGGTFDEVIANDFRGFDGRSIVDILATDVAFEFDGDCGLLAPLAGESMTTDIVRGDHVVGVHIQPGTYVANVSDGCYWERLSGFTGEFDDLITNDFVSTASQQFVTIEPSDVGFSTDVDCGTWTPV